MHEMAESDSSIPSKVSDDESVCFSSDYLSSNLSDEDGLPSLTHGCEVLPYQFEPDPSPENLLHTRILSREESLCHSRIGNTNW